MSLEELSDWSSYNIGQVVLLKYIFQIMKVCQVGEGRQIGGVGGDISAWRVRQVEGLVCVEGIFQHGKIIRLEGTSGSVCC